MCVATDEAAKEDLLSCVCQPRCWSLSMFIERNIKYEIGKEHNQVRILERMS